MDSIVVGVSGVRRQPISLHHGLGQDGQAIDQRPARKVQFESVNPFEELADADNQDNNDDDEDDDDMLILPDVDEHGKAIEKRGIEKEIERKKREERKKKRKREAELDIDVSARSSNEAMPGASPVEEEDRSKEVADRSKEVADGDTEVARRARIRAAPGEPSKAERESN